MMVSFDVIFLYIIKNYLINVKFTRKTAPPQDKVLGLVNLALTAILYTFNFNFHHQIDSAAMGNIFNNKSNINAH